MKVQLADRIRKARRNAGLSQSKAAQDLGVHRGTVGHWERGAGHAPTSANLLRLAVAMTVSYEWLATGRGSMQPASIEDEVPALRLDCFAQSEDEEQVLLAFRQLPWQRRKAIVNDICSGGTVQAHKPASATPLRPLTWIADYPVRRTGWLHGSGSGDG